MNRFRKAKGQLEEFNARVRKDATLTKLLVDGPYDFLQWFQQPLFALYLDRSKGGNAPKPTRGSKAKFFARALFSFIFSLISLLVMAVRRPKVAVFGIDKTSSPNARDFRVEGIYRWFDEEKVAYGDILHTLYDRKLILRAWGRRRFAVHQEAIDGLWKLMSAVRGRRKADPRPDIEMALKWKRRSEFRIRAYRLLLRAIGARMVLSIDDVRHYNELMAACQELGIPFHAFQHGHFTKYHVGWLNATGRPPRVQPHRFHVWSPYWKRELLRLGGCYDEDRIVIGGNPKGGSGKIEPWKPPRDRIGVLFGYEVEAHYDEVRPYLESLLGLENVRVFFSLRPDEPRQKQLEAYGIAGDERVTVVEDLSRALDDIHLVMGTHSTFLYDMIGKGKCSVLLETELDLGMGMAENGLADLMRKDDDLSSIIEDLIETAPEVVPARQEKLFGGQGDISATLRSVTGGDRSEPTREARSWS